VEIWTNLSGSSQLWASGGEILENVTYLDYSLDVYNISAIYPGDQNHSSDIVTHLLTIADNTPPYFGTAGVNDTTLGENQAARFSINVYDDITDVWYVNGTINGVTHDFTDSGGALWYYDWTCTASDSNVDFTQAGARDTQNNWNTTSVTGISLECDASGPLISGETKSPEPSYNDDDVTINATITDPEGNLDSVWIYGNWSGSWTYYYTGITNNGDVYSYTVDSSEFTNQESVGWVYFANDTFGNSQGGSLQTFTVQNRAPWNVTLIEPDNGSVTGDNQTFFNWTNGYDPDGDSVTYTLRVDNDSGFTSPEVEKVGLTESEYSLTVGEALANGVYYWRVFTNDTYDDNVSDTWQYEINPQQAISVAMSSQLSNGINWTIASVPVTNLSANGNNGDEITTYSVEVSSSGTNVDVYIKADGDMITGGGERIGLGNETFSYNDTNSSVPSQTKFALTTDFSSNQIGSNLPNGSVIYLKFFLSAPSGQSAGTYINNVEIKGVPQSQAP
jgi:hypothetical protein